MKRNQVEKICKSCKNQYKIKASRAIISNYCCRTCSDKGRSESLKGKPFPPHIKTKKEKVDPPLSTRLGFAKKCGHLTKKGRKYCADCRDNLMGSVEQSCIECQSIFIINRCYINKYKTCSKECAGKYKSRRQSGSKSHLWKGGLTNASRRQRNSAAYDSWRRMVFERDDYTCLFCGQRGGKLNADHIKEWSLYPALRFDVDNGRTLCFPCHKKTDSFGPKAYRKILKLSKNGPLQYRLI